MLKITTGTNRLTTPKPRARAHALLCKTWKDTSNKQLALVNRIGTFANYGGQEPGFIPVTASTSDSLIASGYYYRLELPIVEFTETRAEGFRPTPDPLAITPQSFWVNEVDSTVHLYSSEPLASTLELKLFVKEFVPIPVNNYEYQVEVEPGFEANLILWLGVEMSEANTQAPGTFSQSGNTITIYGSVDYLMGVGQELWIEGTITLDVPEPTCYLETFHFPTINYLDSFDWLGRSFSAARDKTSPKVGEFFWYDRARLATIFSSVYIPAAPEVWEYISNSGALTYLR